MKGRSFIVRCIASLLILVFSQKTGAGLLYHNLFHGNSANELPGSAEKTTGFSCTCIDDYLMPFEGAEQPGLSVPLVTTLTIPEIFESRLPFYTPVYSCLRGPPAIING